MRRITLMIACMLLASAATWHSSARGVALPAEAEQSQREVAVASEEAARGYAILAEELEINFGSGKADSAAAASATLDDISRKNVPQAMREMAALSAAAAAESTAPRERVLSVQDGILASIQTLAAGAGAELGRESLRGKTQAAITAQEKAADAARRLAPAILGKSNDSLTAGERDSLRDLARSQTQAASQIADLAKAVRQASADGSNDDIRSPASGASAQSGVDEARDNANRAAREIDANRLAQAAGMQEAALGKLRALRDALDGTQQARPSGRRLADLAEEQKTLAGRTRQADSQSLRSVAGKQESLRDDTEALRAQTQTPLAAAYMGAASDEMRQALESLSAASPAQDSVSSQAAGEAAAESQQEAAQYLARAQAALNASGAPDPVVDALQRTIQEFDASGGRAAALDQLAREQEELNNRTRSSASDAGDLRKIAEEQARLKEELMQLQQARSKGSAGSDDSSKDAGRESAPGETRAKQMTAAAASAMSQAASALRQANAAQAAAGQEKASAALRKAHSVESGRLTQLARDMGLIVDSIRGSPPSVSASDLAPLMAEAAKRLESRRAAGGGTGESLSENGGLTAPSVKSTGTRGLGVRSSATQSPGDSAQRPASETWQAVMPDVPRPDIAQSGTGAFPKGYEDVLGRYYEELARTR